MKNVCYYLIITLCFSIVLLPAKYTAAQNEKQHRIDSLKLELSTATTDTAKLHLLEALYKNTLCSDTTRTLSYLNEYLGIAKRIRRSQSIEQAQRWFGWVYRDCAQNYTKAILWFRQAADMARVLGNKKEEADVMSEIAHTYEKNLDRSKALEYYRKSMETDPSPDKVKGVLGNMGNIYSDIGDYPKAADCFERAYKTQSQELMVNRKNNKNDTLHLIGLLISLADVDIFMSQYDKALENYQLAKNYNQTTKDKYLDLMILMGTGKSYQLKNEYDLAINNYEKALLICPQTNDPESEPVILTKLGSIYLAKGALNKAMEYAMNSLKISEENKMNAATLPGTYLLLGNIYAAQKDYSKAVSYLQKAVSLFNKAGLINEESVAWKALSNTYEQMKKTDAAFDAYKHFIALRDSIFSLDKARQITSTELRGEFDRKQVSDSLVQARKDVVVKLYMQQQQSLIYGGFAGLVMVLLVSFFIYRNYKQQKKANILITKANRDIKAEKQVSETLLLNILPADVADELKEKGKVKARLFDNVSVLMTDFVGFTIAGERLSPEALVAELHTCFEAFDNIIGKYKIEKIKTVGDAYVAVSGLPLTNPHHARDIICAALEIRDFIEARKKKHGADAFGIRIGINSGKLVAGIVGVKKFAYDIWGDTVNTAARMEQEGQEGKVNIAEATYELVKNDFTFDYRGEIAAKNKGKLKMYFAESKLKSI